MLTEADKEIMLLHGKLRITDAEVKKQRRRTDKMREAVAAYINGDISRKRLERVYNDTDYSYSVGE